MQYYLAYVLGLPSPAGKKAALGNVFHKALEILAWKQKCLQDGLSEYVDETFGLLKVGEITPELVIDKSYRHYLEVEPHHDWKERLDLRDLRDWVGRTLVMSRGLVNPANLKIVEPEKRFDLTIEEPWAHYRYDTPGGVIEGQLSIKGTIDLVLEDPHYPDAVHLLDWKTGRRLDWASGEEKTYEKLMKDPQLLLYVYAAFHTFPHAETIFFTIVFVNDGGPFFMGFGREHARLAETLIREKFETIKGVQQPALNKSWKCDKLCAFGAKSRSKQDPSKTVCEYYRGRTRQRGADQVFFEDGDLHKLTRYQDGGGRKVSDSSGL